MISPKAEIKAAYQYDAFGRTVDQAGERAEENEWRFSTKPQEEQTGWYYYGFRYYDPETGRWPSRDPIEENGGVNLYRVVGNNPIINYDVMGMFGEVGAGVELGAGGQLYIPGGQVSFSLMLTSRCRICVSAGVQFGAGLGVGGYAGLGGTVAYHSVSLDGCVGELGVTAFAGAGPGGSGNAGYQFPYHPSSTELPNLSPNTPGGWGWQVSGGVGGAAGGGGQIHGGVSFTACATILRMPWDNNWRSRIEELKKEAATKVESAVGTAIQ